MEMHVKFACLHLGLSVTRPKNWEQKEEKWHVFLIVLTRHTDRSNLFLVYKLRNKHRFPHPNYAGFFKVQSVHFGRATDKSYNVLLLVTLTSNKMIYLLPPFYIIMYPGKLSLYTITY